RRGSRAPGRVALGPPETPVTELTSQHVQAMATALGLSLPGPGPPQLPPRRNGLPPGPPAARRPAAGRGGAAADPARRGSAMSDELAFADCVTLAARVRERSVSPVELVQASLDR